MVSIRGAAVLVALGVAVAMGGPASAGAEGRQQSATPGGALNVTVGYKGAGQVDREHMIWIWLFDTPTIDGSSMPIAVAALSENDGTSKFQTLPETVYIAVAYDEKGGYDGSSGPPPSGTPVMVYGEQGTARAVKTGADASVNVTFDDTVRMP